MLPTIRILIFFRMDFYLELLAFGRYPENRVIRPHAQAHRIVFTSVRVIDVIDVDVSARFRELGGRCITSRRIGFCARQSLFRSTITLSILCTRTVGVLTEQHRTRQPHERRNTNEWFHMYSPELNWGRLSGQKQQPVTEPVDRTRYTTSEP